MVADKYRLLLKKFTQNDEDSQALNALVDEIVSEQTKQLREERDLARHHIDIAATALISLDKDGKLVQLNQRACEILEYQRHELIGKNWFATCLPIESAASIQKTYEDVIAGRIALSAYMEIPIITKAGERRLIGWHNTYHKDRQTGDILGVFSSGEDITIRRGIEDALHQNELRYRQMFYANNAVKLVLDPRTGEIVDANEAACQFYGYDYETLTRMHIGQINTLSLDALLEENRQTGESYRDYQFRHRLASGEIRDVEVYTGPMTLNGEELQFSIILDVTEREKSKQALQIRESQFRMAVSHFPNGVMIMFDTDLKCIIARGHLHYWELEPVEQFEGQYLPDALPPDVWNSAEKLFIHALEGKSTRHNFERNDRQFLVQVEPLFDDEDKLIGGLHLLQDITHIRKSEQLLQDTKEQLDTILNGIVDGVAVVTRDEHIMYANDAASRMLGFESASAMMTAMQDGLYIKHKPLDEDGNFLAFEDQALYKALQGETPAPQRIIFKNTETGQEIRAETKAKPILDEDGSVRFAVIILTDMTRAHEIEQFKLNVMQEQAQVEILQKYIANTSHDISQPLSVINTAVYMLDKAITDERVQKRTASIQAQSVRIQAMLNDIRQMSALDTVSKLEFGAVNIQQVLNQIADDSRDRITKNAQQFEYQFTAKHYNVIGNAQYLDKAIKQIIQNAMDYTPENGQIYLRCSEKSGDIIIEVEDTGIGIEESHLSHIFDRFYRVDKSRSTSHTSGTGLGLSIVKRIMDLHGGKIDVESIFEQGSKFRLILPLQLAD